MSTCFRESAVRTSCDSYAPGHIQVHFGGGYNSQCLDLPFIPFPPSHAAPVHSEVPPAPAHHHNQLPEQTRPKLEPLEPKYYDPADVAFITSMAARNEQIGSLMDLARTVYGVNVANLPPQPYANYTPPASRAITVMPQRSEPKRNDRNDHINGIGDRTDRFDRFDRTNRTDRTDRFDQTDRFDRNGHIDRNGHVDRIDRPEIDRRVSPEAVTERVPDRSVSVSDDDHWSRHSVSSRSSAAEMHSPEFEPTPMPPTRKTRTKGDGHRIPVIPARVCIACKSTRSPCWRPSWSSDAGQLCNSCGLRYKKTGVRCADAKCSKIPSKGEWATMLAHATFDSAGQPITSCLKCRGPISVECRWD